MIETHEHCQPRMCRAHEKNIEACATCTNIASPECTLIPKPATCGKCGARHGHCTHKNGF